MSFTVKLITVLALIGCAIAAPKFHAANPARVSVLQFTTMPDGSALREFAIKEAAYTHEQQLSDEAAVQHLESTFSQAQLTVPAGAQWKALVGNSGFDINMPKAPERTFFAWVNSRFVFVYQTPE